mmetsp:Transcript_22244/g.36389  ORF Transcript_22244/g.36389 Transcript_22244/m.36389 type:complete len:252 (-) Transcript_22244:2195-2950(-)
MIAGICHVEVVGVRREFCCKSIDLLDTRYNSERLSKSSHLSSSLLKRKKVGVIGNLTITETSNLECSHPISCIISETLLKVSRLHQSISHRSNVLKLAQEPLVNLSKIMDLINTPSLFQCTLNSEETSVRGYFKLIFQRHFVASETRSSSFNTIKSRIDHTTSFLHNLFKGTTNGHNLTNTKHGRSKLVTDTVKFLKIPSRHFEDAVIQTRLEASGGCFGDGVTNGNQILSERQFGGDISERVAGSLRSKC